MNLKQTINEITQYILEEKFDLVFTNTIKADIYGSIAAKKAKTPVVWRLHDIITTNTFTFPLRILLKNLANRIPERIACVSNATSQSIIAQGVKPNKVITIYNGIDSDKFKHVEKVSVRSEFGISETSILIGIIARLTPWKGQEYFIRAIPSVVQKNRNVKFLIVGDAIYDSLEYKSRLYNLAEELDIKDYVIFTGFRTDIPNILNSLDIFVHASIEPDPFPTSILEAMAYRKCIIATKVGGVPEMIKSNYSGLLINPKSSNDISEAVIKIISNDSLRKQLADNAFLTVKEKFCLGKYVKSFEELFIRLGG
jgi:glycosyltransferase involved in cell wall biosynthesis